MTENEARQRVIDAFGVSRETKIAKFASLVATEAENQNLISASSQSGIWARHIWDSAQLVPLAPDSGTWLDIGTGAGFPGIIVAILRDQPTVLVEPRRRRADFLAHAVDALGLNNVSVLQAKVGQTEGTAAVISARAVGSLTQLFNDAARWSSKATTWVLPRGKTGGDELAIVRKSWHGDFHVEQSSTSPESIIVVAKGLRRR